MLYQLSYASRLEVERETGIEPATNRLEACDSTTELLPLIPFYSSVVRRKWANRGQARSFAKAAKFEPVPALHQRLPCRAQCSYSKVCTK
jgi:hypothetical protein